MMIQNLKEKKIIQIIMNYLIKKIQSTYLESINFNNNKKQTKRNFVVTILVMYYKTFILYSPGKNKIYFV